MRSTARGPVGQDDLADRREVLLLGVDDEERGLLHRGASLSGGVGRAGACYHAASVDHALGIGGGGGVSGADPCLRRPAPGAAGCPAWLPRPSPARPADRPGRRR